MADNEERKLIGELTPVGSLVGSVMAEPTLSGGVAAYTTEYYDGGYSVEPIDGVQIIEVEGKRMKQNIIINPIPSNYGLITRVGARLHIS